MCKKPGCLANVTGSITNWLLPRRCLLCGLSAGASHLCAACADELPRVGLHCPQCAAPVVTAGTCASCLQYPPPFAVAIAPLTYAGAVRYLLTHFKYHQRLSCGVPLAQMLLQAVRASNGVLPQALVPVPIHAQRLAERGFNQSLELARPLGRALGIGVVHAAVQRVRATVPQNQLAGDERVANVRGVFALRSGVSVPKHVAIVDDVLTTGATVREMAKMLRKQGCERVDVWCAAKTL